MPSPRAVRGTAVVHRDGDDSYVGSGEDSDGDYDDEEGEEGEEEEDDDDDPVRLLRKMTGKDGEPLSVTERIALAVKSQSPEARAERIKQLGETRTRRLLKPEQYALRHGNKQLRTYAKKLEREGERIGDVIEVLGQVLGNTGLWIHPEDRKKQPPPKPPTPPVESDPDAPLRPHNGRFYIGEQSSDTDSSSVGSIVHKRDLRRRMYDNSDSDSDAMDAIEKARKEKQKEREEKLVGDEAV